MLICYCISKYKLSPYWSYKPHISKSTPEIWAQSSWGSRTQQMHQTKSVPTYCPQEKWSRSHHKNLWYLQVKLCKQIQISIPLVICSDSCNGYVSTPGDKVVSEKRGLLHAVFKVPFFFFCIAEIVMHLHWKLWHLLPHTRDLAWRTLFAWESPDLLSRLLKITKKIEDADFLPDKTSYFRAN